MKDKKEEEYVEYIEIQEDVWIKILELLDLEDDADDLDVIIGISKLKAEHPVQAPPYQITWPEPNYVPPYPYPNEPTIVD